MLSRQHLTLFALLSLMPGLVCAAPPSKITWTKGAGTPDFVTPGNWESGNATLSTLPNDTTSAVTQFTGPADQSSDIAAAHSVAGVEITADAGNVTLTGNATLTVGESGIVDSAVTGNQSISAPLDFTGNSSVVSSEGSLEISGPVTNGTSQGLHLAGSGNNSKVSGSISGAADLIKDGSGTWNLNAANSYTGKTIVNGGTLRTGAAGAVPNGNDVTVDAQTADDSATFDLGGTSQTVGTLTLRGASNSHNNVDLGPGGVLTLGGDLVYESANTPAGATISNGTALQLGGSNRTFDVEHSTNATMGELTVMTPVAGSVGLTKAGAGKLVFGADNTYSGTTTVSAGVLQIGNGGTAGSVAGAISNNAQVLFNRSDAVTYGQVISGTGSLTQNGSGKLTLAGTNTFTGPITVNSGTLAISSDANLGAAPAAPTYAQLLLNNGTLEATADTTIHSNRGIALSGSKGGIQVDSGAKLTYGGAIEGTGALDKTGSGTLELSGTNSYAGQTQVHAGTLKDTAGHAFSASSNLAVAFGATVAVNGDETVEGLSDLDGSGGAVALANGAKLTLVGNGSFSGAIGGNGGLELGNLSYSDETLTGTNTYTGGTKIGGGNTLHIGNGGTSGAIASGNITTNGRLVFNRSDAIQYGGISGSGRVEHVGGGTLTLTGTNTYTAGTFVSGGTLTDAAANALPSAGSVFLTGAALNIQHNEVIGGVSDWNTIGFTPGNVAIANGATLTITNSGDSFAGNISGAGALALSDGAYQTVTGNATHTGGTVIGNGASLRIGDNGNSGAVAGPITNHGTLYFDRADTITYAGVSGTGNVVQLGDGTLTLSGVNTYSGDTEVDYGTLSDANANAFSPQSTIWMYGNSTKLKVNANETIAGLANYYYLGNASVDLNGALTIGGTGDQFAGAIAGTGSLTIGRGAHQTFTGTVGHTGGTTVASGGTLTIGDGDSNGASISGNVANNGRLEFNPAGTVGYAGVISGTGSLTVGDSGGTLALSGANTYTGPTHVNSSTLRIDTANALPTSTAVSLDDDGTLDIEANQAVGQLMGHYGYVTLGNGRTLTIAPGGTNNPSRFDGSIDGAGALVVNAPGSSVTLTGGSSYSGGTTVNGGALVVGWNDVLGTGAVTLNSGSALLLGDSDSSDVTLSNAVTVGNDVTVGGGTRHYGLGLGGQVSVAGSTATVHVNDSVKLSGGLKAASGTSAVTFDSAGGGFGKAVLLGAIDPSITSINASNAGMIFGAQAAVPASGLSLGANNGYIGVGYMGDSAYVTPGASSVLNLIGSKSSFAGAIGFDTLTHGGAPHTFGDAIDLSGFGAGTTIGSTTQAVLTGTITPGANGYMFGNGGGILFVQSALTGGNVTVSSATSVPGNSLIAVFGGDNSFTGGLSVANSLAVLDSVHALPNGRLVSLGNNGYIGITEAFTPAASLGSFIAHQLAPGAYTSSSVLGLDSHAAAANTLQYGSGSGNRLVSDTIDLSGLNSIYLGTATGLTLRGRIIAPNRGGANKALSLVAAGDSILTVASSLTSDNVSSVVAGSGASFATGTVELQGLNTYAGGTTLRSGTLQLAQSSHRVNNSIVAGPLGTGMLTVSPAGQKEPALTGDGEVIIDNSVALGGPLQLGTPDSYWSSESSATTHTAAYSAYSFSNLVLNGVIGDLGGTHGSLDIVGRTELNGANTFTGGVNLLSGYLALGNDSALGSGGTLTISGDNSYGETELFNFNDPTRTIANPIVITGNGTQDLYIQGNFTLNGSLTLNSPLRLSTGDEVLKLNGPISGPGPLTTEEGTVVMNPTAPTTASGGFTSDEGVLILGNANALPANPAANTFTADYSGYIGIGFVPGNLQTDFLDRFDKENTEGTVGFDSASVASPNTFNTPINLQGFYDEAKLGSATSAILGAGATITPQDTTYNFGGGGGLLRVDSVLANAAGGDQRDVYVESEYRAPLTLRLTGANTYSGGTQLYYSGVIFGAGALPAQGQIHGEYAYVGTEDPTLIANPGSFLSHVRPDASHMIIGFDSTTSSPVTVTAEIPLGGMTDANTYIGTATSAVISGSITLPSTEPTYHFAGFKGGQLTVATQLTGGAGVVIGDQYNPGTFLNAANPGSPLSRVTLTGANTYAGGTYLEAGELFVGNQTALSTGPLFIGGQYSAATVRHVGLSSAGGNITLANAVALDTYGLDVGAGDATFGLSGAITGAASSGLYKVGAGTLTLSGNNSSFAGNVVIQGGSLVFAPAASGNSFGSGGLMFDSASAASATFQDNAVVYGIEDDNGTGTIALTAGKTFRVNQTHDADFNGSITGSTAGLTFAGSSHQLRLGGNNTYVGATNIQSGATVVAGSSTAFGNAANAVSLNGGGLVVASGVTLSNPLTVSSGKLGGSGTITASGLAIGTSAMLTPGEVEAVGTLRFTNSLTFAGGGAMQLRLADTTATAGGWDQVVVGGDLAITAAAGNPFTLQVVPFTAGGLLTSGLPANFDAYAAGSWLIVSANSITGFNANQFTIDSSAFSSSLMGGTFSLAMNDANTGLMLNFTPVPEPSTYALMLAGVGAVFFVSRRRKAKSETLKG